MISGKFWLIEAINFYKDGGCGTSTSRPNSLFSVRMTLELLQTGTTSTCHIPLNASEPANDFA